MAKVKHILLAGALYGGALAAGGGLVGGFMDGFNGLLREEDIDYEQGRVEQFTKIRDESADKHREIVANIGEACVALVKPYTEPGALAYVAEDVVVDDVLTDPDKPCGESITNVRQNVHQFRDINAQIATNAPKLEKWEESLQSDLTDQEKDGNFNGLAVGALALGSLGLAWGSTMGASRRESFYYEKLDQFRLPLND